jgi:hypothetical protein
MPSPFPGMDPWLEDVTLFGGLRSGMVVYLSVLLNRTLEWPYFSDIGQRSWIDPPNDEFTENFVNIFRQEPNGFERLVTTIEVLSHDVKSLGSTAREMFLGRRAATLLSPAAHVEVDLLRSGDAVSPARAASDYMIFVNGRSVVGGPLTVRFDLQDCLPKLPIPLLTGDDTVQLDLQAVMDRAYDAGPYRRRVHYATNRPVPPLTPEQQAWAEQHLRTAGMLPSAPQP